MSETTGKKGIGDKYAIGWRDAHSERMETTMLVDGKVFGGFTLLGDKYWVAWTNTTFTRLHSEEECRNHLRGEFNLWYGGAAKGDDQ